MFQPSCPGKQNCKLMPFFARITGTNRWKNHGLKERFENDLIRQEILIDAAPLTTLVSNGYDGGEQDNQGSRRLQTQKCIFHRVTRTEGDEPLLLQLAKVDSGNDRESEIRAQDPVFNNRAYLLLLFFLGENQIGTGITIADAVVHCGREAVEAILTPVADAIFGILTNYGATLYQLVSNGFVPCSPNTLKQLILSHAQNAPVGRALTFAAVRLGPALFRALEDPEIIALAPTKTNRMSIRLFRVSDSLENFAFLGRCLRQFPLLECLSIEHPTDGTKYIPLVQELAGHSTVTKLVFTQFRFCEWTKDQLDKLCKGLLGISDKLTHLVITDGDRRRLRSDALFRSVWEMLAQHSSISCVEMYLLDEYIKDENNRALVEKALCTNHRITEMLTTSSSDTPQSWRRPVEALLEKNRTQQQINHLLRAFRLNNGDDENEDDGENRQPREWLKLVASCSSNTSSLSTLYQVLRQTVQMRSMNWIKQLQVHNQTITETGGNCKQCCHDNKKRRRETGG